MKRTVDTVAFILVRGGRVLVERRSMSKATDPGAIVVPGGHVEPGESLVEACRRELKEELDVDCRDLSLYAEMLCPTEVEDQLNRWFLCRGWSGEPVRREAEEILWIGSGEVGRLSLLNDRAVIGRLFGELERGADPTPVRAPGAGVDL